MNNNDKLKQLGNDYLNLLKQNNFSVSNTYWFATQSYLTQPNNKKLDYKNAVRFDIDQGNKKIAFATLHGLFEIISFSDIIRYELIVDGQTDFSYVPLGYRSRRYVSTYNIQVYTKNLNIPLVDVPLLWGRTFLTHIDYKNADAFAHQVIASLWAIHVN